MIKMGWATQQDKNEIIDFCDFVFSKYHRPHDFQTLLPKLYGENGDSAPHHFLIREDGHIVAEILAYPVEMRIGSHRFMTIGIGTVSVHPRAKGRGYMNHLLKAADERAEELGAVFSILGGQRQRYGYFGYHPAGYHMRATLTDNNVRHALSHVNADDVSIIPLKGEHISGAIAIHEAQPMYCLRKPEQYLDIARSWNCIPHAVFREDKMIGTVIINPETNSASVNEILLTDDHALPSVLKKLNSVYGNINMTVAPWQSKYARFATQVCESWQIMRNHMYKVYREDLLRNYMKDAGLPADRPLEFDGFGLPLPLFVSSPDCV